MVFLALLAASVLAGPGQTPLAIPPPLPQQAADCTAPAYATDQLVCADPALRAADVAMAELLRNGHGVSDSPWIEDQEAWFRRRSLCAFRSDHRACVAAAYESRLTELRLMRAPTVATRPIRCRTDVAQAIAEPGEKGALQLLDGKGKPIFIAFPTSRAGWQPFMTYRQSGNNIRLTRTSDGAQVRCRPG